MFQQNRNDEAKEFAKIMFGLCKGRRVSYQELADYALNETPFLNPKSMLKCLENQGLIVEIQAQPGTIRRKGSFDENVVVAVTFAAEKIRRDLFDDQ
jgi:hypothetical protein